MPIHTLKDLENNENNHHDSGNMNTSALPNPWNNPNTNTDTSDHSEGNIVGDYSPANANQRLNFGQSMVTDNQPDEIFWSWNLPKGQVPTLFQMILSCFVPCCVGKLCSDVRKKDYLRLFFTVIIYITIIQIIYFIVELCYGGFDSFAKNPSLGPPANKLIDLGAKYAPLIKYNFHFHRLILPIFMHAGIFHIFFNLFFQILIGLGYEKSWNFIRQLIIYFGSGIAGNILSCVVNSGSVSVGASGAILGMIGAKFSHTICKWKKLAPQHRLIQLISCGVILLFTFIYSFGPFIDWSGHLGGAGFGFLIGFTLFSLEIDIVWLKFIVMIIPILIILFVFILSIILFYFVIPIPGKYPWQK